jgi:hypothetical protein
MPGAAETSEETSSQSLPVHRRTVVRKALGQQWGSSGLEHGLAGPEVAAGDLDLGVAYASAQDLGRVAVGGGDDPERAARPAPALVLEREQVRDPVARQVPWSIRTPNTPLAGGR